jgi:hypothetical protein
MTHWAVTHRGQQADFHRRGGFIVENKPFRKQRELGPAQIPY